MGDKGMKIFKTLLVAGALLLALNAGAQTGKRILLTTTDILGCNQGFTLPHTGVQGMDIWGDWLVSLRSDGYIQLYKFDGKSLKAYGSEFTLGSYGTNNHSNLASFSNQFYAEGDSLPLLYVTRANGTLDADGMSNVAFVERIDPVKGTATTIQKICYTSHSGAGQYIIDRQRNLLYVWGNTIGNCADGNKHYMAKFNIPAVGAGKATKVWLSDANALEHYYWEDYYSGGANPVVQGGAVIDDLMLLPTGFDTEAAPSVLYVWDLKNHRMLKEKRLTGIFAGEFEDCSVNWEGKIVIQANPNHIYYMDYNRDNIAQW